MDLVEMIMESEEFHVDIKLLVKINPIYLMELSSEEKRRMFSTITKDVGAHH